MITVYAKNGCGCCTTEMQFNDLTSAGAAFQEAGLSSTATIRDDTGEEHGSIDTFYGFSTDEEEQGGRSLGFLAGLLAR